MAVGWRGQYFRYKELSLNLLAVYRQRSDVQAFLEIILSLVTLIIFTVFALKPTALTMVSLNNELKEKRSTLAALNQKINDLQTAQNLFIENQNAVPIIDSAVFTIPEPDTLAKQVMGLAEKNSVNVTGLSIGQLSILGPNTVAKEATDVKPLPGGAQTINISITTRGSYANLVGFAKDIESLRIPVKIDTLTFSSSPLETNGAIVQLINGRVPFLGQQNLSQ
jgi:hypothetical protein